MTDAEKLEIAKIVRRGGYWTDEGFQECSADLEDFDLTWAEIRKIEDKLNQGD